MIIPLNNHVVIRPIDETKERATESGIVIAEVKKQVERPNYGEVLAVDKGVTKVKVGSRVHYQKLGPVPVKVDGEDVFYVREVDLLGIVA